MNCNLSRSKFGLGVAALFGSVALIEGPARAAQFEYKAAHPMPVAHSLHLRTVEMWSAIERETGGRLKVDTYPNNQLGTSVDEIAQCRLGAIPFVFAAEANLANLTPATGILNVSFAFKSAADVHTAMDGALGDYLRKQIESVGLLTFPKIFESGLRELTSSNKPIKNAEDMNGLKIRVPTTKIMVDLFRTLGASPTALDLTQTYQGLQTHLVEATELPIPTIESEHIYEVQKYISLTNHSWSGFFLVANPAAWKALPTDVQTAVRRNVVKYTVLQTADSVQLSQTLISTLQGRGMVITPQAQIDLQSFRNKIGPYYARWKAEFGAGAWGALERSAGKLG
jgi:TRAP-type transport system periplasmic protein